jgi:hypothetical protein
MKEPSDWSDDVEETSVENPGGRQLLERWTLISGAAVRSAYVQVKRVGRGRRIDTTK